MAGQLSDASTGRGLLRILSGDRSLLFRAESLNFTNHPQFAEPGTKLAAGNFTQITNPLNDGRAFRSLLRFMFQAAASYTGWEILW